MAIRVRLFATLREGRGKYLEIDNVENGKELIEKLQIKEEDIAIFFINGLHAQLDSQLKPGDEVALFPPIGGG